MIPWKAALEIWADRWRDLKAWGRTLEEVTIELRQRSEGVGRYSTGVCYPTLRRIVVTAGSDVPQALATILHELAHAAAPGDEGHGDRWQAIFAAAVLEVTGIRLVHPVDNYRLMQRQAIGACRAWWRRSGNDVLFKMAASRR